MWGFCEATGTSLLGKLALEIRETQPHIHQRIAIGFDTWTTAVAKCLEGAGQRFPAETDLKALSTFVPAVVQGAVAQARAHLSIAPFDTAIQQLRKHFVLLQAVRRWEDEQNEFHRKTRDDAPARKTGKTLHHRRTERQKRHVVPAKLRDLMSGKYLVGELCGKFRTTNSAAHRESTR